MKVHKKTGFTLIETIIATGLLIVLISGFTSFFMISNVSIKKMEEGIKYRSQYQRAFNFMINTIRQNETKGAINIYDENHRVVIALKDEPGKYLHYFIEGDTLQMYVGSEKISLPVLTDEVRKEKVMVLASGVESVSFELLTGDGEGRYLKFIYEVDENKNGTLESREIHEDNINIYVD